jgi:hypothetical protein
MGFEGGEGRRGVDGDGKVGKGRGEVGKNGGEERWEDA